MAGAVLLGSTALAACAPPARKANAASIAERFVSAVSRHDGNTACGLLSDGAREAVSGATDVKCPDAVVNVKEDDTSVHGVRLWGDAAQVRIGSDVVFLVHVEEGWRVTAAGCKEQPKGPYQCDVDG